MTELSPPRRNGTQQRPPPRWMLTFADMMALLFTLFVMLVSFADFDKRKFESTMAPIRDAFNLYTSESTMRSVLDPSMEVAPLPEPDSMREIVPIPDTQAVERMRRDAVAALKVDLRNELREGLVIMEETRHGVVLRFPAATAFALGGTELVPAMGPMLDRVAGVLRSVPGAITVSGHTDDLPIGTDRFRSNWDLSSARAVSVVHYLLGTGIEAHRMSAAGHSDTMPLVPNDTADHRAVNRRVEVELAITLDKKK